MKKYTLYLGFLLVAAITGIAAGSSDTKAIEGSWEPVKGELGGHRMPDATLKTISLKLADGKYEVMADGHPDNGIYTIDPNTSPKAMTVTGTDGPNKGKTYPCIYELDGDSLRICYDLSGAKRPTEFKSVVGTKLYLVTYNRRK